MRRRINRSLAQSPGIGWHHRAGDEQQARDARSREDVQVVLVEREEHRRHRGPALPLTGHGTSTMVTSPSSTCIRRYPICVVEGCCSPHDVGGQRGWFSPRRGRCRLPGANEIVRERDCRVVRRGCNPASSPAARGRPGRRAGSARFFQSARSVPAAIAVFLDDRRQIRRISGCRSGGRNCGSDRRPSRPRTLL